MERSTERRAPRRRGRYEPKHSAGMRAETREKIAVAVGCVTLYAFTLIAGA